MDDLDQYFAYGFCYIVLFVCFAFGIYTMGIPIVHYTGLYTVSTNHAPLVFGTIFWGVGISIGLITGFGYLVEEVIR